MSQPFPAIRPTDLAITLGETAINQSEWNDVWEQPSIVGSLETEPVLELSFTNITAQQAHALLAHYRNRGAGLFPFTLPPEIVAGVVDPAMQQFILSPPGLVWAWAEAPQHQAVKAGRATVAVRLTAELR